MFEVLMNVSLLCSGFICIEILRLYEQGCSKKGVFYSLEQIYLSSFAELKYAMVIMVKIGGVFQLFPLTQYFESII